MNHPYLRIMRFFAAVSMALFSLSCGSGPSADQNVANGDTGTGDSDSKSAGSIIKDSACNEGNIDQRRQKVEEKIRKFINDDDELRSKITFQVVKVNERYLEVYIAGKAHGEDELEDLAKVLRKFFKDKCVRRVLFVAPDGDGELKTRTPAFEWTACESPKIVCWDGSCANEGACPQRVDNSNANSGPTPGSNSNSNASTGANGD